MTTPQGTRKQGGRGAADVGPVASSDLQLLEGLLQRLTALVGDKRGGLSTAYYVLAETLDTSPATPRMWMSRLRRGRPLPRHVRARLVQLAESESLSRLLPKPRGGDAPLPRPVRELVRRLQRLYTLTGGRGRVWSLVEHGVALAEASVRLRTD